MKEQIRFKIEKCRIVSFDIFDTLLLRNLPHPQDLFTVIEEKYQIRDFKKKRIKAEMAARREKSHKEVTLEEIYRFLPGINIDYELKEERNALFANPHLFEIYEYSRKLNKKMIAISDMYLEREFLEKLLEEKGFRGISNIFVSSMHKSTKESGALYRIVLDELAIDNPEHIVHIGDNYHSDVKKARDNGIDAVHYQYDYRSNDLNHCYYKHLIMQQTTESLQSAQAWKLGKIDEKFDKSDDFSCRFQWIIFQITQIYFKCNIMGLQQCMIKVGKKIKKC